ncbi:MAG: insulinase family protein [Bacilli bacterium]|jgi:peptidase M16 inactive domain
MFDKMNEPLVIKNNDFKRCIIFISYPIIDYREEILKILERIAFNRSNKYNTDQKIAVVNINNYCLSYDSKIAFIGNSPFLEFSLSYPSYECLGEDVLEDNLNFIKEIIYNPYLEDGVFPKNKVEDAITFYKNNVDRISTDFFSYYDYKNDLLIDENDYLISKVFKNPSLLDDVTPKGLYDTYNKIISGSPLVYLIGNVDVDKSKELIKKILLNNKISKVRFKMDYYVYAKCIPDKVDVITEDSSFSTVGVYCNYKVRNINSVRDTVLLSVVKNLLYSNVSNILFDSLRKDNDLVYRCYARYTKFGTLTLASFTDKGNFKMIFDIYNDVMKVIEDINYIEDKLPLIIENARIDNELSKENLGDILYEHIDKHLEYVKDKYYDILKTITKEEVSDFIKNRLVMVSKYVGGDK